MVHSQPRPPSTGIQCAPGNHVHRQAGGDPLGNGWGDAGWSLRDEINPLPFLTGSLGMPKAGKDTGGCQLFITLCPQPHLDGRYTVFGSVRVGMDIVAQLEVGDRIIGMRRTDRERDR